MLYPLSYGQCTLRVLVRDREVKPRNHKTWGTTSGHDLCSRPEQISMPPAALLGAPRKVKCSAAWRDRRPRRRLCNGQERKRSMASYVSDVTQFLRDLKQKRPEIERQQHQGRAMYWDKDLDLEQLRRWQEANVPQQGYVYQTSTGIDQK
jgi:hypothetical protein